MPRAFTEPEREEIHRRLRAAAIEALNSQGMRRTSVAALCRAAGISKGAFYSFYDSKEQLVIALLQQVEAELRADLLRCAAGPDPLTQILDRLFEVVDRHPLLALLADHDDFTWLTRSVPPEALEQAVQDDDRWFGVLHADLIARGVLDPRVSAASFADLPRIALALAQGRDTVRSERLAPARRLLVEALVLRLRAPDR